MKKRRSPGWAGLAAAMLLFLAAVPSFAKGGKQEGATDPNAKPALLIASSSPERSNDDNVLLDKMAEALTSIGTYKPVRSDAHLTAGMPPRASDFTSGEAADKPYYALTVTRIPASDAKDNEMVNTGGVTPFNLTLWNFGTGAMVVSTNYSYDDINNVDMLTDLAVMFFLVPPPPGAPLEPIDQAWKAKQFYVEGKLAGASRLYFGHSEDSKGYDANLAYLGFTFITSAEADWQFAYFAKPEIGLAVCSGLSFTFDRPGYIDNADSPHADVWFPYASLEFPLLFRVNWKPSYFSLAAYVGAFAFVPFGEASLAGVPLGITIGVEAGRIVGPGVLSLYLRYSQDLGETKVFYDKPNDPTDIYFKRYSLAFGATYRLGFFKRPQKTAIEYTGGW